MFLVMWKFHMTNFPEKFQTIPQSGYVPLIWNLLENYGVVKIIYFIFVHVKNTTANIFGCHNRGHK